MSIVNSIAAQLVGVGTAGPAQASTKSTAQASASVSTTTTTPALAIGIQRGKVRVKVHTVDASTTVASITIVVTDNNTAPKIYCIGSYAPAAADLVAGQQTEYVKEFVVDPATDGDLIVSASAKVTGGGSITGGGNAYTVDIELAGNN